jgi:hypothetical protein
LRHANGKNNFDFEPPPMTNLTITKILIVLTSHSELGDTGKKTGFWVEELAAPYDALADAGVEITLASPKGGQPPIDPKSEEAEAQTTFTQRFDQDDTLKQKLAHTLKLSDLKAADYDENTIYRRSHFERSPFGNDSIARWTAGHHVGKSPRAGN